VGVPREVSDLLVHGSVEGEVRRVRALKAALFVLVLQIVTAVFTPYLRTRPDEWTEES
jgi:hypothetical protein